MEPFWLSLAATVEHWATVAAIVVGGLWAYYRFGITRARETALAIDLTVTTNPYGVHHLAFFDVCLQNKGAVRLGAKRQRRPAFTDPTEHVGYAADLMLRQIRPSAVHGSQVSWFESDTDTSPRPTDIELDLASEYVSGGETDFWMEPGESYHLGAGVVLSAGDYLGMVTFVGERGDSEFWRRLFLVRIPAQADAADGNEPGLLRRIRSTLAGG